MRRKWIVVLLVAVLSFVGCTSNNEDDALTFKEEYEALNEQEGYREVEIDEDNPFVYSSLEEVIEMMEDEETFIVYFGANWCNWCRSVLPTCIEVADELGIETIYNVNVRPDNDIDQDIRNIYELDEDGNAYLAHEGSDDYQTFLQLANNILLADDNMPSEKKVYAPNFILIRKGVAIEIATGISSLQSSKTEELSTEMLEEMREIFTNFFNDYLDA